MYDRIALVVRSYNRPEYLRATLTSLLQSDIHLCHERLVYDDASESKDLANVLRDPKLVSVPNKTFRVLRGTQNQGCQASFSTALRCLSSTSTMVCILDNDVVVRPDFIQRLCAGYTEAWTLYGTHRMLLTGFNPTNAHLNVVKTFDLIYRKRTCGGVHLFFSRQFLPYVLTQWARKLDWGLVEQMERDNVPLLCLKQGALNHVGRQGLFSSDERHDHDASFSL